MVRILGSAVLALLAIGLYFDAALEQLHLSTSAKLELARRVRAEHDRRLVQVYEKALIACFYGVGFTAGKTVVLCDATRVSGGPND